MMRWIHVLALLALVSLLGFGVAPAHAEEPVVVRLASIAPRGSSWARELERWKKDAEEGSGGTLQVKIFYGSSAGDEVETGKRLLTGKLEAVASGSMLCQRVMPSMQVLYVPGLFQDSGEASTVMSYLQPTLEAEAMKSGVVYLSHAVMGRVIIFSRTPIASMADLRKAKLWIWDASVVERRFKEAMGLQVLPMSLENAGPAYDRGEHDGFFSIPGAALAFQWFSQVRYMTDLPTANIVGCVLYSRAAFDRLTLRQQQAILDASGRLKVRMETMIADEDAALIGRIFPRQGVKAVPVSDSFRAQFFDEARIAREKVGPQIIDPKLLDRVIRILADYRAERRK